MMNDPTYSNFDNYYCASIHQVIDVNPITLSTEYDEIPPTTPYINNVSCDMTPLTQTSVTVDQRHQSQGNLFNFVSNSNEELQNIDVQCQTKRSSLGSSSSAGPSPSVFANIPFVQIHTTNVQPQRTSYGNVFRRNVNKQDEIKSEPIKFENAEAAKERTNATPTPPRPPNQTQNEDNMASMDVLSTNEKSTSNIKSNNTEDKNTSFLQIYNCSKCPFISLRETERDEHIVSQHGENNGKKCDQRQPINCPGCSNIFFNQEPMQIHLKFDHFMREDDVFKLLNILTESNKNPNEDINNTSIESTIKITTAEASKEPIRKSRIYLKNVDCLREPKRQPMEQTDNQLEKNINCQIIEPAKKNPPKQKISIKSVDVLREPALLRRDYEMQNSNMNNYLSFNNDLLNNSMDLISNLNTSITYDFSQNIDNTINNTNLNNSNNDGSLVNANSSCVVTEVVEKPRKPKIYVKSVESFNLMPLNSIHSNNNNNTDFINDHNSSCTNAPVYDSNMVHLPTYMYDSNSTANNLTNNSNYLNNHNDMDTYQFVNTSNVNNINNNYILESSLFLGTSEELNVNGEQIENITLIPDATTPTPPATADLTIMNKPSAVIQEQRGTLHLRTVDELNLMNKTEVQHLIAPNLDNNHTSDVFDKVNSSSLNDINLIGDDLYEDENFKFHDLDTQMVNDWPETYEDLAEDINCIIADASNENSADNLQHVLNNNDPKMDNSNFDISTPQVSLITIRDIEELTGTTNQATAHSAEDQYQQDVIVDQIQENHNRDQQENDILSQECLMLAQNKSENVSDNNLKRELVNTTPESNETSLVSKVVETNANKENSVNKITSDSDIPPLVPVTNIVINLNETNLPTSKSVSNSDIPLPPLVPVSPMTKQNTAVNKPLNKLNTPVEKGRIYVANNLMEPPKRPVAVSATCGTSVRGRPFGSNRIHITRLKETSGNSVKDLFSKCSIKGCAFRFKNHETVEYHRKCHDMMSDSPQAMLCPECKSAEFNNWNTLHTHLWRVHQVDMELYKCELCEFKTPIFSRLVNTHAKIHFDDRNYKCEHCEKAFKNSKQLKNHRRWHRVQTTASNASNVPKAPHTEIHRCTDCGSTFSQPKTLREHCCKKGDSSLKCTICEKLMSSKSSLKLHLLTHSDGEKRYKCHNCDYATNDHNAFRRHRMGHENRKMYECIFCQYKSVQSVAYQKHILQKHPEKADTVIHKCTACSYATINRSLLIVHKAKHEKTTVTESMNLKTIDENSAEKSIIEKSLNINVSELQKSKIKVKSNLFTTNITNETIANMNNNDFNLVQLYNVGSVT